MESNTISETVDVNVAWKQILLKILKLTPKTYFV